MEAQEFLGIMTVMSFLFLPLAYVLAYFLRIIITAKKESETGHVDPELENAFWSFTGTQTIGIVIVTLVLIIISEIYDIPATYTLVTGLFS